LIGSYEGGSIAASGGQSKRLTSSGALRKLLAGV
jgi:hypothetical protein